MNRTDTVIKVELGARSYPILLGSGLISRGDSYAPFIRSTQVMVVTNETVAALYLRKVKSALKGYEIDTAVLPDGERHKTLASVTGILDRLLQQRFHRDCTVLALGGGVIGDMGGFAAACYQRGVALIQVPTTLLSQVDSSVGGKTGVNHPLGKNMIGAFHQPSGVVIDIDTLTTLPGREFSAGMAEVIKYALIDDREFFHWLWENMDDLMARDRTALCSCIARCCRNKARLIAQDEREYGRRALLNLGHTFGHAIEAAAGYGNVLHGEAVAIGMSMAADMSSHLGLLTEGDARRIRSLLRAAGLPVSPPQGLSRRQVMALMQQDKKVHQGVLRLVLLQGIGEACLDSGFEPGVVEQVVACA